MTANPQTLTAGAPKARRDFEDLPPVRREDRRILGVRVSLFPKILAPVVVGVLALIVWHLIVVFFDIPHYVLPRPWLVIQTLFKDWGTLSPSLWVTLRITGLAFLCAAVGGLIISVLFTLSKWVEMSFFPYAVTLQVTPIVAIAPLIIIWAGNVFPDQGIGIALLISAWIVAFFPIVSNTTLGLNSTDHNLLNLFLRLGEIAAGDKSNYMSFYLPPTLPTGHYTIAVEGITKVPQLDGTDSGKTKEIDVTLVSNSLSFEVYPCPYLVQVKLDAPRKIRRGEVIQLQYTAVRHNGFIGKIHTELAAPGGVQGIRGRGVTFVGQTESGVIQIIANEDAPLGQQRGLRLEGLGTVEDEPVHLGSCFLELEIVE